MTERFGASFAEYSATLQSLRNPRGASIIWTPETITELWGLNADLGDLLKLFSYEDDQGTEKFFSQAISHFMKAGGYTPRDWLKIADLVDHEGKPILQSSNDLWDFVEVKGSIADAIDLSRIHDSEGLTVYRYDTRLWGGFDGMDAIADTLKTGATALDVQPLVDTLSDRGVSVFRSPRDINRFLENKGTLRYAETLLGLRDDNGQQLFDEFSLGLIKEREGTIEYVKEVADLSDTKGRKIFSSGEDIVDLRKFDTREKARSLTLAKEVIDLKDAIGNTVFRDGGDIVSVLRKTKFQSQEVVPYLQITNQNGDMYFNGRDIVRLLEHDVPIEYIAKCAQKGLNAATIMYYFKAGFDPDQTDFTGNNKPKLLALFPSDDPGDLIGAKAFSDPYTFQLLKNYTAAYDLKVRAISSVVDLYNELDQVDDIYFLILGGHGGQKSIRFGASDIKYGIEIDENIASLTPTHRPLSEHLSRLTSLRYILLDACLTGKGRKDADNMVNFIAESAPGVTVIGPTEGTNSRLTTVEKLFPPKIKLSAVYTLQDCTYTNRVKV